MVIDWTVLSELRSRFLAESGVASDYWRSRHELEQYEATFAQRIGWKWNGVLSELRARGFGSGTEKVSLVDWGCGTGIATRRFLEFFPRERLEDIWVWDRSILAREFARELVPGAQVLSESAKGKPFWILVSHVLGELDPNAEAVLLSWIERAAGLIWVEPGTPELSGRLVTIRESLREGFRVVGPCPHQKACGMLSSENARNWCHFFASPPSEVFQSAHWAEFGKRLKIDLRSLPVSYLALERNLAGPLTESVRMIGRPRMYKGYAKFLECASTGVTERTFRAAEDREHFKELKKEKSYALK